MSGVANRVWCALVLCAGGCNTVFGLDETEPVTVEDLDSDDDGLLDVIDNCPLEPNPLQEDGDRDDVGDVCDPCLTGSNHDEDGDGALDGCDNCPHVANADQADQDQDTIGDVCEVLGGLERRVRFDGFEVLDPFWIPTTVEWQVVGGDAVDPVSMPPSPAYAGLWHPRARGNAAAWMIEAGVILPADGIVGLNIRVDGAPRMSCFLIRQGAGPWYLSISATSTQSISLASVPTPSRLRVGGIGTAMFCELVGVARVEETYNLPMVGAPEPSIYTDRITRITYVEVVTKR